MDKGKEIYKNIIDTLVDKSKSCVSADCAISGKAKKVDEYLGVLEMSNGITIPFDDILRISSSDNRRLPDGENPRNLHDGGLPGR